MVLPASSRIPRVPLYSGSLPTEPPACRVRDSHPLWSPFPVAFHYANGFLLRPGSCTPGGKALQPSRYNCARISHTGCLGSSPFARRYSGNLMLMSSPRGTEMVQFPRLPLLALCVQTRMTALCTQSGYPIRLSTDLRMCAPPHGFSQLTTAFLVRKLQGIHRKPVFA